MKNQTDGNSVPPENAGEYGKFKTAGDLLAAYNALESEFTKKCQSLKRLQAQLELLNAQAEAGKPTGDPHSPPPNSDAERDGAPPIATAVATPPTAENFARAADTSDPNDPFDDTSAPQDATVEVAAAASMTQCGACAADGEDDAQSAARRALETVVQHAAEFAETLAALPEIMDACVARYKQKLLGGRAHCVSPAGMAVIAPVKRPRTLYEAKLLADELLNEGL